MAKVFLSSIILSSLFLLTACEKPGQSAYKASEVGVSRAVEFGTVIGVREVKIIGNKHDKDSDIPGGAGLLGGGAVGAGAASYAGGGTGQIWSAVGGAVVGAVAGDYIEQKLRDSSGYEYVLTMQDGDTKTITLEKVDGDEVFKSGDKVMLQYCDAGSYKKKCKSGDDFQRLIKVDKFPPLHHHKKKHPKSDIEDYDDDPQ